MNDSHYGFRLTACVWFFIACGTFTAISPCSAQPSQNVGDPAASMDALHRTITAVAWDSLGAQIVAASDSQLECIDPKSLQSVRQLAVEMKKIGQLAFSADGKYLLVAGGNPSETGCVELYDWPNGRLLARHTSTSPKESSSDSSRTKDVSFRDVVTSVCWLPDQSGWIEGSWQGLVLVRSLDGTVVTTFDGHSGPLLAVACLDDQHAVSAGIDQTIRIWNRHDGTEVRSLDNHTGSITWLQSKPNPSDSSALQLLSASTDSTVRLWEPGIGRLVRFARLGSAPLVVCHSPTDSRLLVGLENDSVLELDMRSLETKVLLESSDNTPTQKNAVGDRIEAMLVVPALAQESTRGVIVWRQSGVSRLNH
jgi:WD40 repeat protein